MTTALKSTFLTAGFVLVACSAVNAQVTPGASEPSPGLPAPGQEMIQTPANNIMGAPPLRFDDRTSGALTGMRDTQSVVWFLDRPADDDLPATGWTETAEGLQVRLVGYPSASPDTMDGVLQISFTLKDTGGTPAVDEVRVTHDPSGPAPFLIGIENDVQLSISEIERSGEILALSGDIVAVVSPNASANLSVLQDSDVAIDGNFEVTIVSQTM